MLICLAKPHPHSLLPENPTVLGVTHLGLSAGTAGPGRRSSVHSGACSPSPCRRWGRSPLWWQREQTHGQVTLCCRRQQHLGHTRDPEPGHAKDPLLENKMSSQPSQMGKIREQVTEKDGRLESTRRCCALKSLPHRQQTMEEEGGSHWEGRVQGEQ